MNARGKSDKQRQSNLGHRLFPSAGTEVILKHQQQFTDHVIFAS